MKLPAIPRLRRPLFWLLPALAAVVAAWGFWPRAVAVDVARIEPAPLAVGFSEEARTQLSERWLVSAPLAGTVERIELRPGDRVSAGQPVAILRPASAALFDPASRAQAVARASAARQAEASATAAVAAAEAERLRSAAELARMRALASERLVARTELDRSLAVAAAAEAALRSARAQREAVRGDLAAARAVLALQGRPGEARLPLAAPVSGEIVRRYVESAAPVAAGQPLLEIGDPAAIEVVSEILTADAVRLAVGMPVTLTGWGGDASLRGRVLRVEPGGFTKVSALGVEEQRVLVRVAFEDPPAARRTLGDGFRLQADFLVWQSRDALVVPTAALFRDGADWAVYVVAGGRARLRHVRLRHVGEDAAELAGGLARGDMVVLYPGEAVGDGTRVAPRGR